MILGIVQARLGATRLPGKMLLHLSGHAVVEWVYRRMARCRRLDRLVFALPEGERDEPLAMFLRNLGADVRRGPELDVLGRFHRVAREFQPDHIVRICADNPLVSWEAVDSLVEEHLRAGADYSYNHIPRRNRWPDGLGAEICTFACLDTLQRETTAPGHREHVFGYLWDHPDAFRIHTFDPTVPEWQRPELKLDLDTWSDYRYLMQCGFTPGMRIGEIVHNAKP